MEIILCQLILGDVSVEDSPQKTSGFQTLLHGESLDGPELAEAEARLSRVATLGTSIRRVFHRLSSRRILLARLAAEPADGKEASGERCFAHGLVLSEYDFMAAGGDVGTIFDNYPFLHSVDEARQVGDWRTGLIVDHTYSSSPHDDSNRFELLAEWPTSAVQTLVLMALRANAMITNRTPLVCKGDAGEFFAFLSAVLVLLPPIVRINCTYDTIGVHGAPETVSCWALCESNPAPVSEGYPFLDISARHVTPDVQPVTPFERWITLLASKKLHDEIVQQGRLMFWFSCLLEGRKARPPIYALQEIPQYYFKNELTAILTMLQNVLGASYGKKLGARLTEYFDPQQHRTEIETGLFGNLQPEQACDFLALAYREDEFHRPEPDELAQLAQLLQKVPHRGLQILHSLWSGNIAATREQLARVSEAEYGMYVRIFLIHKVTGPASLIVPSYITTFVQQFISIPTYHLQEVDNIVSTMLELKVENLMDALIPLIEMSDTPVLQAVEKICRGKKTIPTSFQTTLQSQLKRGKGGKGSGKPAKSDEGSDGSSRPPEGGMDTVLKRFLEIMPGKK